MCLKKTPRCRKSPGWKIPWFFFVTKQELEHCNEEIRDLEKKKEEISVEIRRKFEVEWKVNFASWDQLDINWDSVLINLSIVWYLSWHSLPINLINYIWYMDCLPITVYQLVRRMSAITSVTTHLPQKQKNRRRIWVNFMSISAAISKSNSWWLVLSNLPNQNDQRKLQV